MSKYSRVTGHPVAIRPSMRLPLAAPSPKASFTRRHHGRATTNFGGASPGSENIWVHPILKDETKGILYTLYSDLRQNPDKFFIFARMSHGNIVQIDFFSTLLKNFYFQCTFLYHLLTELHFKGFCNK
jgi:hypothetical protein